MIESFALKFGRSTDFVVILHGFEDVNLKPFGTEKV
jgi:hypothetical protein